MIVYRKFQSTIMRCFKYSAKRFSIYALRGLQGINRLLDLADATSKLIGMFYAIGICFFAVVVFCTTFRLIVCSDYTF